MGLIEKIKNKFSRSNGMDVKIRLQNLNEKNKTVEFNGNVKFEKDRFYGQEEQFIRNIIDQSMPKNFDYDTVAQQSDQVANDVIRKLGHFLGKQMIYEEENQKIRDYTKAYLSDLKQEPENVQCGLYTFDFKDFEKVKAQKLKEAEANNVTEQNNNVVQLRNRNQRTTRTQAINESQQGGQGGQE